VFFWPLSVFFSHLFDVYLASETEISILSYKKLFLVLNWIADDGSKVPGAVDGRFTIDHHATMNLAMQLTSDGFRTASESKSKVKLLRCDLMMRYHTGI
jgi:hypothetical protein